MKKQLLSILLCLIMVVGLLPTAALAEEAAPAFDLATALEGITIPDNLVTCICTKTGERKSYGKLPGGFSASKKIEKEDGVWTVIISVESSIYMAQFNKDMGCEHTADMSHYTDFTTGIQFKLKYEENKWVLHGEMPKGKELHFTCTDKHTAQSPAPTITEDDLAGLNILTNLVTVKCQTTGDSKAYGRIPGGFDLSNATPYMENGVWKAIVKLNLSAYKAKYDADTKKTHENAGVEGNTHTAFTLKYVNDKWELDGDFPNVIILVKCDGQHPQTPPHPTEENVGGLEQVQVRVQCSTDTAQFKNYGILPGGVSIMPDANDPSQATLTLIPSVYSKQYTIDTGITHIVDPNQATDNLKIQMRYDPAVGKWMPAGELTPLVINVKCNNHQGQRYTITFNGNGGTPSVTSMTTIDQKLPELPIATRSGRYSFDGWYTEKNGGTKITKATVFDKNTTVYAHWTYTGSTGGGVTTYPITVKSAKNGDVTASHKSAAKGTTITLTVDPDKGYVLDTLTVLDGKDKEIKLTEKNGKYTFTMPASKVTVEAMFKAEQSTGKNPFTDVPAGSYYEDAVIWAVDKGITTGTSATTFNPNGICTRAQAVTFLWRAAGSPAAKSSAMPFADVKAGSYYETAVLWAVENGITKGTSDTMFSPDATCTRAQIVTFLWRSQKSPAAGTANPFTDVKASAYYADAVLWAVKHNITVGTTFSIFSPDEECTRAQIVTFLYRARNK